MNIWSCKIGESDNVPKGADAPMRQAVKESYRQLTGKDATFCFSGWGAELTESERAVVEDREPVHTTPSPEGRLREALESTDDLVKELLTRFDHAVFAGMKVMSEDTITKDGGIYEMRRTVGNTRVCQGLCFELMCRKQAEWEDKCEGVDGDS